MSEQKQQSMTAVSFDAPGDADVLHTVTLPLPQAGEHEVLLRVIAAGVNRPDILQRQGMYPVPADASPLPGLEVAGFVEECGTKVERWQQGDAVMILGKYGSLGKLQSGRSW